jgi:hypothetical protein
MEYNRTVLIGYEKGFFTGTDQVMALTHGRLYLLCKHVGRDSDADEHMRRAVFLLERTVRRRGDLRSLDHPKANLLEFIEKLDKKRTIAWKESPAATQLQAPTKDVSR